MGGGSRGQVCRTVPNLSRVRVALSLVEQHETQPGDVWRCGAREEDGGQEVQLRDAARRHRRCPRAEALMARRGRCRISVHDALKTTNSCCAAFGRGCHRQHSSMGTGQSNITLCQHNTCTSAFSSFYVWLCDVSSRLCA